MIRFAGAAAVTISMGLLIAGTQSRLSGPVEIEPKESLDPTVHTSSLYRFRLTPTFDAERDPFALAPSDGSAPVRLQVRINGREAYARTNDWRRGEPVTIGPLPISGSRADLFVMATPSASETGRAAGIRVEWFHDTDAVPIGEQTLWSEPGAVVSIQARIALSPSEPHEPHARKTLGHE